MNFKNIFLSLLFLCSIFLFPQKIVNAQFEDTVIQQPESQVPQVQFYKAQVVDFKEVEEDFSGNKQKFQITTVNILDGNEKGKTVDIKHNDAFAFSDEKKVQKGETVVVTKTFSPIGDTYYISDKYRIPSLYIIFAIFFGLVVFFGRLKGFTSILGLLFTIFVITKYIVPNIISGNNPFFVAIIGTFIISIVSIYLSHGLTKRTTIAVVSTLITLGLSVALSEFFVQLAKLYGMGSESSFYLQMGPLENINLKGLLLGGILIGTLGVLDDVTTAQSAAIDEISKADRSLDFKKLYSSGLSVGREHIASLVNTLALAYAGASLPLFLLFTVNPSQPLWSTFNSEFIAEEIVRTLVGSSAIILAVPVTTLIASWYFGKKEK